MYGIRKKITIGFCSLAIILFFSGVISLLELNRLSQSTASLLEQNKKNIETAKQMLDAVQNQNTILFQMVLTSSSEYDSLYRVELANFDYALEQAKTDIHALDWHTIS